MIAIFDSTEISQEHVMITIMIHDKARLSPLFYISPCILYIKIIASRNFDIKNTKAMCLNFLARSIVPLLLPVALSLLQSVSSDVNIYIFSAIKQFETILSKKFS